MFTLKGATQFLLNSVVTPNSMHSLQILYTPTLTTMTDVQYIFTICSYFYIKLSVCIREIEVKMIKKCVILYYWSWSLEYRVCRIGIIFCVEVSLHPCAQCSYKKIALKAKWWHQCLELNIRWVYAVQCHEGVCFRLMRHMDIGEKSLRDYRVDTGKTMKSTMYKCVG